MLAKHQLSLKQVLVTTVLVLFIAILLTSITSKMVLAQSSPTINLNPAQGPPGATIYISGEGFPLGSTETIKINSAQVGTAQETTETHFQVNMWIHYRVTSLFLPMLKALIRLLFLMRQVIMEQHNLQLQHLKLLLHPQAVPQLRRPPLSSFLAQILA